MKRIKETHNGIEVYYGKRLILSIEDNGFISEIYDYVNDKIVVFSRCPYLQQTIEDVNPYIDKLIKDCNENPSNNSLDSIRKSVINKRNLERKLKMNNNKKRL